MRASSRFISRGSALFAAEVLFSMCDVLVNTSLLVVGETSPVLVEVSSVMRRPCHELIHGVTFELLQGHEALLQWMGTSVSFRMVAQPLEFLSSFKVRTTSC